MAIGYEATLLITANPCRVIGDRCLLTFLPLLAHDAHELTDLALERPKSLPFAPDGFTTAFLAPFILN
jgi:hypothetical protein